MWWGYHGFWCFGFLVLVIIVCGFIVRSFTYRHCGVQRGWKHHHEATTILQRRLADGKISEEEYQRLKDLLDK